MLDLLAAVTEQVRSGEATGLLLATKLGEKHHGVGMLGDYLEDPAPVMSVTARVNYLVNELISERLRKPKGSGVTRLK